MNKTSTRRWRTPFDARRRAARLRKRNAGRVYDALGQHPLLAGAVGTVVAVSMVALSFVTLYQGRAEALDRARETSWNLVSIISGDIARNIELADLSLQAMVDGVESRDVMALPPDLRSNIVFDRATSAAFIGSALVLDANGRIVMAQRTDPGPAIDYTARDYFIMQRDHPHAELFISHPFRPTRSVETPGAPLAIALSRRIETPSGQFAGIALLTIQLDYFNALLAKVSTGRAGSVFIVERDGTLLARRPLRAGDAGKNIAASPTFGPMARSDSGAYAAKASVDGVRRLYTYARVPGTPMITVVAPAEEDVLAPWRGRSVVVGGLTAVFGLSFIVLSWLLAFSLHARARTQAELVRLAGTDSLTGLNNRRALDRHLDDEWRRARRSGAPMSVLFLDVDNFKAYNDTYGHAMGDDALAAVADCIEAAIQRPGDIPARYGGEEFVVILPDMSSDGAMVFAEKLRAAVESLHIAHSGSAYRVVTVSIGCACGLPRRGGDVLALIGAADAALYDAKSGGRNRVAASHIHDADRAGVQ